MNGYGNMQQSAAQLSPVRTSAIDEALSALHAQIASASDELRGLREVLAPVSVDSGQKEGSPGTANAVPSPPRSQVEASILNASGIVEALKNEIRAIHANVRC